MHTVDEWLDSIGLSQYAQTFKGNDIGYSELPDLTEDDFRSLGVSIGHMRKMLRAAKGLTSAPSPAERRQVSVLFADIVGFTQLSSTLDPEDLLDIVNDFQTKSREVIEDYRGMVVKFVGDGLLAFFGWPTASERDPVNCVRSARKLVEMVEQEIKVKGTGLELRVGVATGLAVVGDLASSMPDVFGDVPNLAARLQTLAEPNSVMVSDATHELVKHVFACDPSGPLEVKGLGAVSAWHVVSEHEVQNQTRFGSLGQSPMQGRETEMNRLRDLWDTALKNQFQIVVIEGEAGLGKTRLVSDFVTETKGKANLLRLSGSPDAGQRPLQSIQDLLAQLAGFTAKNSEAIKTKKLLAILDKVGLNSPEHKDVFAELCDLPLDYSPVTLTPERRRALLFESITALIDHSAQSTPTVLLVEDLHWLDPNSFELVTGLGGLSANLPVMMIATTRPELAAPWTAQGNCTQIKLKPLDRDEAAKILQYALGGGNDVLGNVFRQIIDRADGIPLYLEELSRSVHMTIDNLAIPSSLQDSLMARLDRLGEAREVALAASILGRDIEENLLTKMLGRSPDSVRSALDQLVSEQVLHVSGKEASAYRFRHALLREAAYDSQLMRRRREMHSKAADVLVGWIADGGNANPETIGHHLSKAERSAEATSYFRQAGLLALGSARYVEAEKHFNAALSELEASGMDADEPSDEHKTLELEIKTELGSVLIAREGFAAEAVGTAFTDAERLGRELGPGPALVRALWGTWLYKLVSGDLSRALDLSQELLALGDAGKELDGGGVLLEASWALGNTQFWTGDLDASIANLEKSVALYDPAAHGDHAMLFGQDPYVAAHCYMGYTQSIRGEHAASWAAQKTAVAHAKKIDHPFTTAWSLCFPAVIAVFREEVWAALKLSEAALRHTSNQMMPFWQTAMTMVHGWAVSRSGKTEEGLAEAQAGLDFYIAIGSRTVQPFFRGLVADCYAQAGQMDAAQDMMTSAFALADETGELLSEMLLHKQAGAMAQAHLDDTDKAIGHYMKSLKLAQGMGAHATELDAALALARLGNGDHTAALRAAFAAAPEPKKSRTGRRADAFLAAQ